jgi:hypothetical protein
MRVARERDFCDLTSSLPHVKQLALRQSSDSFAEANTNSVFVFMTVFIMNYLKYFVCFNFDDCSRKTASIH